MILLAAGNSVRMGRPKAMLTWPDGVTFAERLTEVCRDSHIDPVILVVNREVMKVLPDLSGVEIVINDHIDRGRFYSLLLGLEKVSSGSPVFIHNIDNPYLDAGLLKRMALQVNPGGYVVPVHNRRRGHPVLFGGGMTDEIRGMDYRTDMREVIKNFAGKEIVCDQSGIHWNINTPEDYRQFMDSFGRTDH
ncbi:MAG: NTP transferase domain-containing protein [bacterium]